LSSHKEDWKEYPFLNKKGLKIIRMYSTPHTAIGMGMYAAYKNFGEDFWRIGYESKTLKGRAIGARDKVSSDEIEQQLIEDLKVFSQQVSQYVLIKTNKNRRAALLSFAHSLGLPAFKTCRLLDLINNYATKTEIIKEWSPYMNRYWLSGGEAVRDRRRTELDLYFAADKEIPTLVPHKCEVKYCLLNLMETYNGTREHIKAVEYLERKFKQWDPSGEVLRRFYRYWSEKPKGLGSPQRRGGNALEDQ
tara:strand:+ start:443 stop:1186 length:744 start_codon:yes stop_codon:yes gene_type:complete